MPFSPATAGPDSGAFGEGETYGISGLAEIVGLYYNKKLLDEAGVKTPIATFEDFLAALDALKAKGIAPFMIGTAKNHMALHMIAAISQAHIDASNRKELDDLIYGRGGTWKTPGNLDSAKLVQDWANDGYFFDGHSGISGDDAVQLFIAGQGAFLISGHLVFRRYAEQSRHPLHGGPGAGGDQGAALRRWHRPGLGCHQSAKIRRPRTSRPRIWTTWCPRKPPSPGRMPAISLQRRFPRGRR